MRQRAIEAFRLAEEALDSPGGEALVRQLGALSALLDLTPEGASESLVAGLRESPDAGSAMAAAHLLELDECTVAAIGVAARRVARRLCLGGARETLAVARLLGEEPSPESVVTIAAAPLAKGLQG
jgi:hypothetical protein